MLRWTKVNGCLIFALLTCRLDVLLSLITGLNSSWTRHLQNVSPTHYPGMSETEIDFVLSVFSSIKNAEFDDSKFCEEKESENITASLPRRQSFLHIQRELAV